jgi:hypothetical protein
MANQWSGSQKNFMIMGAMLQHLPQLMASKPQLTIKQFYFDTPDGRTQGQLLVNVQSHPAGMAMLNPQAWLQAINGQLDLSLPKTALQNLIAVLLELPPQEFANHPQVQEYLTQWVAKGWFIVDQDTELYKTAVQLQQGGVTVNGRAFNPSEMRI